MASDLQNLVTRRSAIYAELAAMVPGQGNARPNIDGGGMGTVDHVGYRKSLWTNWWPLISRLQLLRDPTKDRRGPTDERRLRSNALVGFRGP